MNQADVQDLIDQAVAAARTQIIAEQAAAATLAANAAATLAANDAAAAALAATAFSLTPGVVNAAAPWDYKTSTGFKIYFQATTAITPTFDGKQENLKVFLQSLKSKASTFGWDALILAIPDGGATIRDLLVHYGMLTVGDIRTHAITYVGNDAQTPPSCKRIYRQRYGGWSLHAKVPHLGGDHRDASHGVVCPLGFEAAQRVDAGRQLRYHGV
jgi:hypothetical protein